MVRKVKGKIFYVYKPCIFYFANRTLPRASTSAAHRLLSYRYCWRSPLVYPSKISWFVHEFGYCCNQLKPVLLVTKCVRQLQQGCRTQNVYNKKRMLSGRKQNRFHGLYMNLITFASKSYPKKFCLKNTWFVHEIKILLDFPYQIFMVCT